jgi:hypothetical protein
MLDTELLLGQRAQIEYNKEDHCYSTQYLIEIVELHNIASRTDLRISASFGLTGRYVRRGTLARYLTFPHVGNINATFDLKVASSR